MVYLYILPAPYIVCDFLEFGISENTDETHCMIVPKNGIRADYQSRLRKRLSQRGCLRIIEIDEFEMRPSLNMFRMSKKIRVTLESVGLVDVCYVQSLQPFYSKYITHLVINKFKHVRLIGLQMSLPVFLFRDKKFLQAELQESEFKLKILSLLKGGQPESGNSLVKKKIKNWLEGLFEYLIFKDFYYESYFINSTSYVPRGFVDLHYTNDPFYAFCLENLYKEDVILLNNIGEKNNNGKNGVTDVETLVILGPVSQKMVEDYVLDVLDLLMLREFETCVIRPHPRFTSLAKLLASTLRKTKAFKDVSIGDGDMANDNILGYFSSVFLSCGKGLGRKLYISERATVRRYPNCPIEILSGRVFGFSDELSVLRKGGNVEQL